MTSRLEELQNEQCLLQEDGRLSRERLMSQVSALQGEKELLLEEVRKKERETGSLREEMSRERREQEKTRASLRRMVAELKETQETTVALTRSRQRSKEAAQEKEEDNQKMRAGLKTAMQEMATLKQLLEDSLGEGERLRNLLQERKEEVQRNRGESVRATRAEVEELRRRTRELEHERKEVERTLRAREEELEEALREKKRLKEELGEKEAELTTAKVRMDVLLEQRSEFSSLAASKGQEVTLLQEVIREVERLRHEEEVEVPLRGTAVGFSTPRIKEMQGELELMKKRLKEGERKEDSLKLVEQEALSRGANITDMLKEHELEQEREENEKLELEILENEVRKEMDGQRSLKESGEWRDKMESRGGAHSPELENEAEVVAMRDRVASLLLEKEDSVRLLRLREADVHTLTARLEQLGRDRERIRAALEKCEAALIGYQDRARRQEDVSRGRSSQVTDEAEHQLGQNRDGSTASEPDYGFQERLLALQRTVARLELDQKELQRRNSHLEQRCDRLRAERKRLREMLTQDSRGLVGLETEEIEDLRNQVKDLEHQLQVLRLSQALDHQERAEFIERSSRNNQWLVSLRQDLTDSLSVVSQQPVPSVLESETHRLDQSAREEELRLSLSHS
ncbi:hypothetical protein UPYG_G00160270 [Umbra pygmaea]|uniref:Uncharacterized protein n=1 Tax=Umbra pygmaea TaxID=75934 RepID=A0ABD0X3L3_UMBPY